MEQLFKPSVIWDSILAIIPSIPITMLITLIAGLLGLLFGFILAVLRIKKIPVLAQLATVYISFIRGTPLLVQLFLSYYGIPMLLRVINYNFGTEFNISGISNIIFAFAAFSFNEAAYNAETIRASILSVDRRDIEAAHSRGMTGAQTMRRVILPQAMIVAIPNLGNSFINLVKATSLAYAIGVMDMMGKAKVVAGNNMRFFEAYIGLALLYWVICLIFEFIVRKLEKKFNILDREVAVSDTAQEHS